MEAIAPNEYLGSCKRRFGATNPEQMRVPVWEWMVKTGNNPYAASKSLGIKSNDTARNLIAAGRSRTRRPQQEARHP